MKTNLAALLVGLTVLGSAGMARAEAGKANPTEARVGVTQADSKTTGGQANRKTTVAQADPVLLTNDQMDTVTAGHFTGFWHVHTWGPYYTDGWYTYDMRYDWLYW
jgi:Cu/Zn superoxide dismutase